MASEDNYDLKPVEKKELPAPETPAESRPKPGEPGWVEPVPVVEKADEPEEEATGDPDVEKNKGLAILGYIFFVIPLVAAPQSKFARFHANQALLVFITGFAAVLAVAVLQGGTWLVGRLLHEIWILDYFFACIFFVLQVLMLLGVIALAITGIVHAANGERKTLPLVGHWMLIK